MSRLAYSAPGSVRSQARGDSALDPGLAARNQRRVLVVDDNVLNQRVAVAMLEYCGYAPDTASNGAEAVAAVERGDYDIVFMDIQMPGMDGLQATREIRRRVPAARQPHIAGLTSGASGAQRDDCVRAGMDDLMAKPFRPDDLVHTIERSRRR